MLVTAIMSTTQYTWQAASKLALIVNDSAALHNVAHKEDFPDTRTAKYCHKHCGYQHTDYAATVVIG
jgi:hypothetical protein